MKILIYIILVLGDQNNIKYIILILIFKLEIEMKLNILEYSDLSVGQTRSGACPTCGKRKFYVTRKPNGYAFICFRASCPTQGFAGSTALPDYRPKTTPPNRGNPYRGEFLPLDAYDIEYFYARFSVDLPEKDPEYWVRLADDSRYAFPIWGPRDEYRGVVLRRPIWGGFPACHRVDQRPEAPKTVNYFEPDVVSRCAWYHSMNEHVVVIVEDQVSAMRIASEGFTAVAILGTDIKPPVIRELLEWDKDGECRYILALDPDARGKALQHVIKWGGVFPTGLSIAMLERDPKDYPRGDELRNDLGL